MADFVAKLPPPAREKFRLLERQAADARALRRDLYDRIEEARSSANKTQAAFDLYARRPAGWRQEEQDRLTRERDEAKAALARQVADRDARAGQSAAASTLFSRTEKYVAEQLPASGITLFTGRLPLQKETAPLKIVEHARAEIERVRQEIYRVTTAPKPSDEVAGAAMAELDQLAERGEPDIDALVAGVGPLRFATAALDIGGYSADGLPLTVSGYGVDVAATLCWLFRDEIGDRLIEVIRENTDDAHAIASRDRPKLLAALRGEQLQWERIEESAIDAGAVQGGALIVRRGDCDVRATLGLADSLPAPRD
jgi:hypothetical protein